MPNIMKNVQHINTMFPMGLSEDSNVCTTSFKPGARFITLSGRNDLNSLNTCKWNNSLNIILNSSRNNIKLTALTLRIPNILGLDSETRDISRSIMEIITKEPSMMFHPDVKYASGP
jgi:hypothetical protein